VEVALVAQLSSSVIKMLNKQIMRIKEAKVADKRMHIQAKLNTKFQLILL